MSIALTRDPCLWPPEIDATYREFVVGSPY